MMTGGTPMSGTPHTAPLDPTLLRPGESRRRASGEAVSGGPQSHRHGQANLEERAAKGAGGGLRNLRDGGSWIFGKFFGK